MRLRRSTLGMLGAVGLILVAGPSCDIINALDGGALLELVCGARKDNIELMADAEQIVGAQYPLALLIEVQGYPSSGSATVAKDIDQWTFVFVEDPNSVDTGTVLIDWIDGEFGAVVYVHAPWGGTVYDALPRQMNLARAIELMREAGHTAPFTSTVLRKPLTYPPPTEAIYAFPMLGRFVIVGAVTGEVSVEIPED